MENEVYNLRTFSTFAAILKMLHAQCNRNCSAHPIRVALLNVDGFMVALHLTVQCHKFRFPLTIAILNDLREFKMGAFCLNELSYMTYIINGTHNFNNC